MAVKFIGDSYEFPSADREENFGGDIGIFILWEQHLMFTCPSAYRVPTAMPIKDFLETLFKLDYAQHPDTAKIDWDNAEWKLDEEAWTPDLDKSFADNGVGHHSFMRLRTPGLEGLHGVGN